MNIRLKENKTKHNEKNIIHSNNAAKFNKNIMIEKRNNWKWSFNESGADSVDFGHKNYGIVLWDNSGF